MKKEIRLLLLASILSLAVYAERPTNLSANYKGVKMWNTEQMVSYNGTISLEIRDSIAYLKYKSFERVDTFFYDCPYNNGYRYVKNQSHNIGEFLIMFDDALKLQVGLPNEVNYFYQLQSTNGFSSCPECLGTGEIRCPRCQGSGRVTPRKNGSPDEAVGICPFCHGERSITHSPCRLCNGSGMVEVQKQ